MRTIVLCISDTHGGFKLGLMNPKVKLIDWDEEGNPITFTPESTAIQKYFWKLFTDGCKALELFARGDSIVAMHFGDATHGYKYPKTLVTTELADQPAIAISNFEPILTLPNVRSCRLVAGTDAHNFDDANAEKLIINNLKLLYPDVSCGLVVHGLADVDGVEIEYAHQGAFPGSKNHLKGNVAHQYLRDKMIGELMAGNTPPQLYIYGHYHEWLWVSETVSIGDKDYTSHLMVMPSFNFPNLWTTAATRAQSRFTHGIVALEIIDGKITDYKRFTRTVDRRTKEKI